MTDIFPSRIDPKSLPDDWRDTSLYRAAVRLNNDRYIPVIFPETVLEYLWDLGYTLPRQGAVFVRSGEAFMRELATLALPIEHQNDVGQLNVVMRQRESAIAKGDFETASNLRDRERKLKYRVTAFSLQEITRDQIASNLRRVGVISDSVRSKN